MATAHVPHMPAPRTLPGVASSRPKLLFLVLMSLDGDI